MKKCEKHLISRIHHEVTLIVINTGGDRNILSLIGVFEHLREVMYQPYLLGKANFISSNDHQ